DHDGLLGLGAVAVAAEPATQMTHVKVDVLLGNPRDLRRTESGFLRALIADPDVDAIVGDEHGGVAWLHAGAREIRGRVRRLDDLRSAGETRVDVALIDTHLPRPIDRGEQRLAHA